MFGMMLRSQRPGSKRGTYRRYKRRQRAVQRRTHMMLCDLYSKHLMDGNPIFDLTKTRRQRRRMEGHGNCGSGIGAHPGMVVSFNRWTKPEGNPGQAHDKQGDDSGPSSDHK